MTSVILWKEYRQQRALWLMVAATAVLLVVVVAEIMGRGNIWDACREDRNRAPLLAVELVLAIMHGLATGALLLAADKENGALDFLDILTGKRGSLFARKVVAGVLFTLSQSCILAALTIGLGFGGWEWAIYLPLLSLDGLVWGLFAGALWRSSLTAMLTGIALLALSWPALLVALAFIETVLRWTVLRRGLPGTVEFLILVRAAAGLTAGFVSWLIYCRDDLARKPASSRFRKVLLTVFPQDWRVLLWLVFRQGRAVLIGCLVGTVILGFVVPVSPGVFWPMGTMLLGLACGLAAFTPDQNAGNRFLGSQRFPPGRIWGVKVVFWGVAATGFAALAWLEVALPFQSVDPNVWVSQWTAVLGRHGGSGIRFTWQFGDHAPLFAIWPLYGFFFGQFFGQVLPRPVIATVVAVILTPLIAALWVPSLMVAGVQYWEVLVIPAILLATTRLIQWPWLSTRLTTAGPLFGIATAFSMMALSLAGCFWYRAVEVPDVGEPFDMKGFLEAQSMAKLNQAGRLLPAAVADLVQQESEVGGKLRTFGEPDDLASKRRTWLLDYVVTRGWPKKDAEEIGRWLDQLFDGAWASEAEEAARQPLGILQDRHLAGLVDEQQSYTQQYARLARLFVARALQRQANGDSKVALNHLQTLLALSRQVANYASGPQLYCSYAMEGTALTGIRLWLQEIGPEDKALLPIVRAILKKHQTEWPDPANAIKAKYVIYTRSDRQSLTSKTRFDDLMDFAYYGVPWEKERLDRIIRARVKGQLEVIKGVDSEAYWVLWHDWWRARQNTLAQLSAIAAVNGLPHSAHWGELVTETWYSFPFVYFWKVNGHHVRQELVATDLIVALVQYQADHNGSPPSQLKELVPTYLANVPDQLLPDQIFMGGNYTYSISKGEPIEQPGPEPLMLVPGQAFISCGEESFPTVYPVPVWPKGKEKKS